MRQLHGALVVLAVLVSAASSQYYDPRTRGAGRTSYLQHQNLLHNIRHLISRHYPAYAQSSRNAPSKHLDLGLPMSLLNSDGSLLLHLKDSDLWKKENAGRGQSLEAAFMPMFLKSLERSQSEPDTAPEEPENHAPPSMDPKDLLNKMLGYFDMDPNLTDEEEDNLEEIVDDAKTHDKSGLTFNLRNAFQKLFEKHVPPSNVERTSYRSNAARNPGVFFNLKDLERQFEHMYESMHGDEGLPEFVHKDGRGGISFNIADIIKEELALEKEKAKGRSLTDIDPEELEEMDMNEQLAEGLRNSNIPVGTDENGGVYFNLNNTQN